MAKLISADELYKRRGVFADDIGKHGWREAINNLPAAEPERKMGKWIRDEFGSVCSSCGLYAYRDKFDRPLESDYCPNCGADMRQGER